MKVIVISKKRIIFLVLAIICFIALLLVIFSCLTTGELYLLPMSLPYVGLGVLFLWLYKRKAKENKKGMQTCGVCGIQQHYCRATKDGNYCCPSCMNKAHLKAVSNLKYSVEEVKRIIEISKVETVHKCNVCGNVFCYTLNDIQKNAEHAKSAVLSSVGSISGALSGHYAAGATMQGNANNSAGRVIDYNKCPKCNSTDLRMYSKEAFEQEKQLENTLQTTAAGVSSADELKKYKELLDCGVITQKEFDGKKKQLLGL